MTGAKELFQLQEIDSQIGAGRGRLAQIEGQLQGDAELTAARSDLEERQGRLRALESDQKALEWDVENTRARIAALEKRMYGDQAAHPRELQSMVTETTHLKQRQGELEEQALGIMEAAEEARRAVESQRAIVGELEARWGSARGHLLEEKAKVEADLSRLEGQRARQASTLAEPSVRVYERLRAAKGGVAVASVERGVCTGCRITLPTTLVQQARSDRQFTYCSSCGRLLFVR